ncbi:MAG: hypothetical protein ACTTKJ_06620 [Prevotella koreensis]|uniref:hypothetical protein n=1 Tax=Prevotella koreensis TaxID=2490854 RepID=UPI003FA05594
MSEQVNYVEMVLDAYFDDESDNERFTSQDICDNLHETVSLTPDEVTKYMIARGYSLVREYDRLVWTKV